MDYKKTAKLLITELGGKENIKQVTHCMTRLRFILHDESKVRDERVKMINGVLGVMWKGGQYQVIIGNEVQNCYREIMNEGGFSEAESGTEHPKERKKLTIGGVFSGILDAVSGSMTPLLPAIIGCGMIKLVNIVLGLAGVSESSPTYQLLAVLGDAAFYFLPILLAYTASKKFGCSTVLAMTLTAVLVHPDLVSLFADGSATFLGLPVTASSYSSSVIPALLITWILTYVERFADRITPGWTKNVFKPMIILLIMLPLGLVVLAPLGTIVGDGVQAALAWLQTKANWLTMMLFSAAMPFIVMTGMHYAFVPGAISDIGTKGFDSLLIPAMLASNLAQGAASLAVMLRTRNRDMKAVAGASAASALAAGITEPALYGVTLRLKRPLAAACIGAGLSGLFIGIVRLKAYTFATPALISLIQFISPDNSGNFVYAIAAALISIAASFLAALLLGWEEEPDISEEKNETGEKVVIESPVRGEIIPLAEVNDETFSTGVLGEGFAVIPSEGRVYAPFDGVCDQIFGTLHAVGLRSIEGVELLVHIGLETVSLGGKPFRSHISRGDSFRKGDVLIEFDIDSITAGGCETTTPIVVTNADEKGRVTVKNNAIIVGG